MPTPLNIVVCAGIVPDPLQTLEPTTAPTGPGIKNEIVLPAVLDPWAASALYEAGNLAAKNPGSKVWLVTSWAEGQAAAGHDDRSAEGELRAGSC